MSNEKKILAGAIKKGPDCLTALALESLAAGEGSVQEKEHMTQCGYCGPEVALLRSFELAHPNAEEAAIIKQIEKKLRSAPAWRDGEKATEPKWWAGRRSWGLALASLATVIALSVFVQNPALGPQGQGEVVEDVVRSGKVEGIAPLGDLTEAPDTLRWGSVAGTVLYEVQLLDVEGTVLWQWEARAAELQLPAEARAWMTARKTLKWRIVAKNAQGLSIASSSLESFRVVAK